MQILHRIFLSELRRLCIDVNLTSVYNVITDYLPTISNFRKSKRYQT
jgi:hypothetical protein